MRIAIFCLSLLSDWNHGNAELLPIDRQLSFPISAGEAGATPLNGASAK